VHGILTFIKRLTNLCLQSLYYRFSDWTKPDTATSLLLGVLTDVAKSKSELVAENALLRQQLIILRRRVKRPACTRADRMLLVRAAQEQFAPGSKRFSSFRKTTRLAVASPGISALLEVQIEGALEKAEALARDDDLEQGDGSTQPTLGSGAYPWGTSQVGYASE